MIYTDTTYGTVTLEISEAEVQAPALFDNGLPTEDQVAKLEQAIPQCLETYDIDSLTQHFFCEGLYARWLDIPKGAVIVGKRHSRENFFILAKGDMTVWTSEGMKRVSAPFMVTTKPGEKRVGYAHEDSVTINFHANPDDCKSLDILETRYITPEASMDLTLLENME